MHLALRGRTLLLERFRFLHDRGSSHGGSRIFRHAYEDVGHVRLAVAADAGWVDLEARSGEKLLFRTGGLDIGTVDSNDLTLVKAALEAAGRPLELLSGPETASRFPAFGLSDEHEALYQPDAGVLAADRAVATLLRQAVAEGATLVDGEAVLRLEPSGDAVEVVTDKGRYSAGRVVVAAGAWLPKLVRLEGAELTVQVQQVLYLRTGSAARHFGTASLPVFIQRGGGGSGEVYGLPSFELPHAIKVADHSSVPPGRSNVDPDHRPSGFDEAWAGRTAAAAMALLPDLAGEIVASTTCLYTNTSDGRFIIDKLAQYPNVIVAGGGSGHAFKFGPVLGEAVADLATIGRSRHDIGPFALGRFAASGTRGASEGAEHG